MSRLNLTRNTTRKYWRFLIWPDSAVETLVTWIKERRPLPHIDIPEDFNWDLFLETVVGMDLVWWYLDELQVPMMVSPLHNLDVKEDGSGEFKKPHYHVHAEFDGPFPYGQFLDMLEPLGVKILKLPRSRSVMEKYTIHKDSPGKAQYDECDIRTFGGYQIKYLGDEIEQNLIKEMHDLIEEQGMMYYADLANEVVERHSDMLTTLLKYPNHWRGFMASRRAIMHDNDNASYVKYVKTRRKGWGR